MTCRVKCLGCPSDQRVNSRRSGRSLVTLRERHKTFPGLLMARDHLNISIRLPQMGNHTISQSPPLLQETPMMSWMGILIHHFTSLQTNPIDLRPNQPKMASYSSGRLNSALTQRPCVTPPRRNVDIARRGARRSFHTFPNIHRRRV